ncbi:glycine--tRNA ligase subunit beta [Granulicella sp. 5B5]|uniref:glycine--tRNA ligase subunit beta n=1 Tax=Granulicella sp. 5B5 TaxID=1617967 RepID=UPI0015F6A309|nr:glycine--tRNA ligase subunit beta [Granulicella sp. 5B5]QMV19585.1 glycine--tRNA ligase subunit beta [Granulicella sp. 5B5]
MPDFLLEIGLEEIPARMIPSAEAELLRRTLALLGKEALLSPAFDPLTDARSYSTPRRLAVFLSNVEAQQSDITEETTGPAVKIAFKDGVPTPAAEAFARKSGLTVADLKTISTPKGDYLAATITKKGRSAAEVIASELPKEIAALYWAKNMRWIPGSNERFVRPVLWLACLLDDTIVPIEFAGRTAGRATYGHRVLSTGEPFDIQSPTSYLAQLEGEYVIADVEARRHKIRKALDHVTRTVPGARWREDEALVDAVTHLTEWPDVLLGSFEPTYLELPEEVLVTVMRDHQKYFAVEDADGKLAPHFLTVTNIALNDENSAIIKQGNERVLRARFNDARFFWEFDQRTPLTDRVKLLENVTFQKDLGSYAKKSQDVLELASRLANAVMNGYHLPVDTESLYIAARLAKTDLTTELVKEFTELQGIIGGLYARSQGISKIASDAIYDQYIPSSMDDLVPRSIEGAILGVADRSSTIARMFSIGLEPTGSKDPFALKRAANAIVKILAETNLPVTISSVCIASAEFSNSFELTTKLDSFFKERIEFYLREARGQAYDVIKAVMAAGAYDLRDLVARSEAVTAVRGSADFLAVCAGFKRMKNILAQASEQERVEVPEVVTMHPAEQALRSASSSVNEQFVPLATNHQYVEALEMLATLRPQIDIFFEEVMVMDPDPYVRNGRLGLLDGIIRNFSSIADFSEIVTSN